MKKTKYLLLVISLIILGLLVLFITNMPPSSIPAGQTKSFENIIFDVYKMELYSASGAVKKTDSLHNRLIIIKDGKFEVLNNDTPTINISLNGDFVSTEIKNIYKAYGRENDGTEVFIVIREGWFSYSRVEIEYRNQGKIIMTCDENKK